MLVETRRQLVRHGSVLLPHGSRNPMQVVRLGSMCLYPLSHLSGPPKSSTASEEDE